LADFQKNLGDFEELGVRVVAASVEELADAKKTVAGQGLGFPVGYGLDALEIAARCGAFYDAEKKFLHATGFLLRPDGSVCIAAYSTGPIGRMTPADSLRLIKYYQKQDA
jgi:peroxiredoxin